MPPAPKASSVKKAGSPKAKGAVRAKSGCYTCRIRRKKCDEKKDPDGNCTTCVRLRLQCLGFGQKRPDWLRDGKKVVELREKIKGFLASQGMIKGHSGSAARSSEEAPPYLTLSEEQCRPSSPSSSESPASETSDYSPASPERRPATQQAWGPGADHYPHDPASPGADDELRYRRTSTPSDYAPGHKSDSLVSQSLIIPTQASSFGYSYSLPFFLERATPEPDADRLPYGHPVEDPLMIHYRSFVSHMQYLLAGQDILRVLADDSTLHSNTYSAVTLLADIDRTRRFSLAPMGEIVNKRTGQLVQLRHNIATATPTFDDAMAALHAISTYLFDGGTGDWQFWLPLACDFVRQCLESTYGTPNPRLLVNLKKKHAFIVKTAIWFDVLASLTLNLPPRLRQLVEQFFTPTNVEAVSNSYDLQSSMVSPMGCDNRVVWALTEALKLAQWKSDQIKLNRLSIQDLVVRGDKIYDLALKQALSTNVDHYEDDRLWNSRHFCAQVFRCTTILFLRSVVSGDYPYVPEIQEAHQELMDWIRQAGEQSEEVVKSVVRSTVAGYFLAGVFATCPLDYDYIRTQLLNQGDIGNCATVLVLLQELHELYPKNGAVPWRLVLSRKGILLV